MRRFKKGDVVQLLSGGDKMTIDSFNWITDEYYCVFVNQRGRLRFRWIHKDLLNECIR